MLRNEKNRHTGCQTDLSLTKDIQSIRAYGFTTKTNIEEDLLYLSQHPFSFYTIAEYRQKYSDSVDIIDPEVKCENVLMFLEDFMTYSSKITNQEKLTAPEMFINYVCTKFTDVFRASVITTQVCEFVKAMSKNKSEIGLLYAKLFGMCNN